MAKGQTPTQLASKVDAILAAYDAGGKAAAQAKYAELAKGAKAFEAMVLRNSFRSRLAERELDK